MNGESLKFTSCCHSKIRAKRRQKFERRSEGRSGSKRLKEKCVVLLKVHEFKHSAKRGLTL